MISYGIYLSLSNLLCLVLIISRFNQFLLDEHLDEHSNSIGKFAGDILIHTFLQNEAFISFFKKINLFIYFWLNWISVAARGLPLGAASVGHSSLRFMGLSLRWFLLLWSTGSRCVGFSSCGSRALECRLGSCGAWAQLLRGMQDPPGPGLKPTSSALAGRFPTTAPPGKPHIYF